MMATRLEVRVHIVTASSSATQNMVTAVNKAGVHVDDTIFEPLACADSVLRSDERELGVCLVDLGAGSCDLIVFQQGAVAHTAVIPDWRRPLYQRSFGWHVHAAGRGGDAQEKFRQCRAHADPRRQRSRSSFGGRSSVAPDAATHGGRNSGAASPRTFRVVRDNLRHAGVLDHCIAGLVLSGGASRLPGILDVAESVLRKAARLAWPTPMAKMPSLLAEPEFATVLGMVYYGHRARLARGLQEPAWVRG